MSSIDPQENRQGAAALSVLTRTANKATYLLIAVAAASSFIWTFLKFFAFGAAFSVDSFSGGTKIGDYLTTILSYIADLGFYNGFALVVLGFALRAVGGDINGSNTHKTAMVLGIAGLVISILTSPYRHYLYGY